MCCSDPNTNRRKDPAKNTNKTFTQDVKARVDVRGQQCARPSKIKPFCHCAKGSSEVTLTLYSSS